MTQSTGNPNRPTRRALRCAALALGLVFLAGAAGIAAGMWAGDGGHGAPR